MEFVQENIKGISAILKLAYKNQGVGGGGYIETPFANSSYQMEKSPLRQK